MHLECSTAIDACILFVVMFYQFRGGSLGYEKLFLCMAVHSKLYMLQRNQQTQDANSMTASLIEVGS